MRRERDEHEPDAEPEAPARELEPSVRQEADAEREHRQHGNRGAEAQASHEQSRDRRARDAGGVRDGNEAEGGIRGVVGAERERRQQAEAEQEQPEPLLSETGSDKGSDPTPLAAGPCLALGHAAASLTPGTGNGPRVPGGPLASS